MSVLSTTDYTKIRHWHFSVLGISRISPCLMGPDALPREGTENTTEKGYNQLFRG